MGFKNSQKQSKNNKKSQRLLQQDKLRERNAEVRYLAAQLVQTTSDSTQSSTLDDQEEKPREKDGSVSAKSEKQESQKKFEEKDGLISPKSEKQESQKKFEEKVGSVSPKSEKQESQKKFEEKDGSISPKSEKQESQKKFEEKDGSISPKPEKQESQKKFEEKGGSISPKSETQELQRKMGQFQSFWEFISTEKKKEILVIGVQDLWNHIMMTAASSLYDPWIENFEDAIGIARKNGQNMNCWEFWLCSHCDETFTDSKLQEDHLREHGKGSIVPRLDKLAAEWADTVLKGTWKPVDVTQALKLLDDHKEDLSTIDLEKLELPFCDDDDSERATLLVSIRDMFIQLQPKKYLDSTNLTYLMRYIATELQGIIPPSQQESLLTKMAKSHLSICFLDVPQHNNILLFLQDLSDVCDKIEEIPENATIQVKESIVFSEDNLLLNLDESTITGSCEFIHWLFRGPSTGEAIELWTSHMSDKKSQLAKYMKTSERALELLNARSKLGELYWNKEEAFRRLYKTSVLEAKLKEEEPELASTSTRSSFPDMGSARLYRMIHLKLNLNHQTLKRNKVDGITVRISVLMKKLVSRFKQESRLDYRLLLLPLVKSFLQEVIRKRIIDDGTAALLDDKNYDASQVVVYRRRTQNTERVNPEQRGEQMRRALFALNKMAEKLKEIEEEETKKDLAKPNKESAEAKDKL